MSENEALPLVILAAGLILILSSVKDLDPIQALKNLVTGKNPLDAKHASVPQSGSTPIPSAPGSSAPTGETYKTGYWKANALDNGWLWIHMPTKAELERSGDNHGDPPGASPPWRWHPGRGQWIDENTLTMGPLNNPNVTPYSGGTNQPATYGGSDPGAMPA